MLFNYGLPSIYLGSSFCILSFYHLFLAMKSLQISLQTNNNKHSFECQEKNLHFSLHFSNSYDIL